MLTPLEIKDFSGGMSDELTGGLANQAAIVNNFFVTSDKELIERPGSESMDASSVTVIKPFGATGDLINYRLDTALLVRSSGHMFWNNSGTWQEIIGPNSNPVFKNETFTLPERSLATYGEWEGHTLLVAHDPTTNPINFVSPMKVYQDTNGAFQVLNAGLPKFPNNLSAASRATTLASAITLANSIRSAALTHSTTTYHAAADVTAIAAAATNEATLIVLTVSLQAWYKQHIADARQLSPTYHNLTNYDLGFGHFYLPDFTPCTDTFTCVPILNSLKRNFEYHMFSFVAQPSPGSTMDTALHLSGAITISAVVSLNLVPTVETNHGVSDPFYAALDEIRVCLNAHYDDRTTGGGHINTAHTGAKTATTINSERTALLGYYKMLLSYGWHRATSTYNSLTLHNGSEPAGSIMASGSALGSNNTNAPLHALNMTSSSDLNTILTNIVDLVIKASLHVPATGRHVDDTGVFFSYFTGGAGPNYFIGSFVNYEYALTYKSKYTVSGGVDFEDISTPYIFQTDPVLSGYAYVDAGSGFLVPVPFNVYLASIPVMAGTENYPSATVTKEIYRSISGGTTLYKMGEMTNSTTTYTDTATDTFIQTQPVLYTTNDLPANDPPPKAKVFFTHDGIGFYGYTVETPLGVDTPYPRRLRQSIDGDIDSCPEDFFVDLESDIVCGGVAKGYPIVVCKQGVYRIDGTFSNIGQGGMVGKRIAENVGGVSGQGGATFNDIYFFAGNNGFYWTDGFQVQKISLHLETRYAAIMSDANRRRSIQCKVDRKNQRILWSVQEGGSGYNDAIYALDLKQPLTPRSTFTQLSNGTTFVPTAFEIYGDLLYRGDYQGFIFKHTESLYSDAKIDRNAVALKSGVTVAIPFQFRSLAENFGTDRVKKWVPTMNVQFQNLGNLDVLIRSINDLNTDNIRPLNIIRFRQEYSGVINEKRTFPASTVVVSSTGSTTSMPTTSTSSGASWVTYVTESISAGGTITSLPNVMQQLRRITGVGAVTASTTPFGTSVAWADGTVIRLAGQSNVNSVTLVYADTNFGALLNGPAELTAGRILELQYDALLLRWVESFRNF